MKAKFYFTLAILCCISIVAYSQDHQVSGKVVTQQGEALPYATAVLLHPEDSTLIYYGITDKDGWFKILNVENGSYLLQVAFVGYRPLYRELRMPEASKEQQLLVLEELRVKLGEVEVVGDAVPLMIKGDTVEYMRAAYKVREGDVVEDLLRKLPGIEVDRAGNVKAMGEDVKQVYVDGKEFFGSDPKMATKNLPAEAVDKVQMYDKKSDNAEFTGIDDGSKEKALNIVLDKDMKNILFGSLEAGGGLPAVYDGSARVFYRTDRMNTALLGMMNTTNNPGFSFSDYMNFSGSSFGGGGTSVSVTIGDNNSLPVNFGQSVYGLNTTGAGGVNFSYATDKFNRTHLSYLFSGTGRKLTENSYTRNYLSGTVFDQYAESAEYRSDTMHMFTFGLERRLDSLTQLSFLAKADLRQGHSETQGLTEAYSDEQLVSTLDRVSANRNRSNGAQLNGSLTHMFVPGKTVLKVSASASFSSQTGIDRVSNQAFFSDPYNEYLLAQYRDDRSEDASYSAKLTFVQKVGPSVFMEPSFRYSGKVQKFSRSQGISDPEALEIDSLSPEANLQSASFIPGMGMRWNGANSQLNFRLEYQAGSYSAKVNEVLSSERTLHGLLPSAGFEYTAGTGRRLSVFYRSEITEPSPQQLYPLVNNLNPQYLIKGNAMLEPEKTHSLAGNLLIFDQFSLTSLFISFSGDYTLNKINWSRTIDEQLVQVLSPVNVDYGFGLRGNLNFSRPIRKLGLKMSLALQENYQGSLAPVNGVENQYSSMSHDASLSFENRKKQKWDVSSGIGLRLTTARYSLREGLNDRYFDLNWFSDISYTPSKIWDASLSADILNYNQQSFEESVFIPYLQAEVNVHLGSSRRATLSLKVNDLLNRQTGIDRYSDLNYLQEVRRSVLGRYILLSFRYRLNKGSEGTGGIDVKFRR